MNLHNPKAFAEYERHRKTLEERHEGAPDSLLRRAAAWGTILDTMVTRFPLIWNTGNDSFDISLIERVINALDGIALRFAELQTDYRTPTQQELDRAMARTPMISPAHSNVYEVNGRTYITAIIDITED